MSSTVYFRNLSGDTFAVTSAAGVLVETIAPDSVSSFFIDAPGSFFVEDLASAEIRAFTLVDGSAVAVSSSMVVTVAPQGVHVGNPVQGMEFVILAAGFVCGAITWRFLMGRW